MKNREHLGDPSMMSNKLYPLFFVFSSGAKDAHSEDDAVVVSAADE